MIAHSFIGKKRRIEVAACYSRRRHMAILATAFAALSLGLVERATAGGGQETPPGCTFAGAGASMTRFPPTNVQHGQEICYQIQYSNGAAGINCEIRNFDADLFFPNGTSLPMMAGATIASGEVVTCPNPLEPRCLALSNCTIPGRTGYRYIVAHSDEVFDFTGCPPIPTPGIGKIVAYTDGDGDSLTDPPDFAAACATANNNVPHGACCDKCIPSCTDNVTENECTAPGAVFIPGGTCALDCIPLNCNDGNTCTTDCCIPAVPGVPAHCTNDSVCIDNSCAPGTTPQTCNDNNACTGPDVCDGANPPSCCSFPPITCPPAPVCFTRGPCDPATGCPDAVSDCVTNPNLCDDNNECTRDICDVTAPGCCRYEDIPCTPPPVCYSRGPCNPKTGCPPVVSDCVTFPNLCDDGNPCTTDICDESAPGCCRNPGECPCRVSIDKTVAADLDCNGIADDPNSFEDSITVDKTECVVYKICVSNTGEPGFQNLNGNGVTVEDAHLGIVVINFGTLVPGQTECRLVPSQIFAPACSSAVAGGGAPCHCQDVEGTNTARITSAVCEITSADACTQSGSKCNDNARVSCTGGCRITAGRTNRTDKRVTGGMEGPRGQGGGQVGAPCGCSGCFTTGDPEADDAFEHIQGNWQYDRKYPDAEQFKQGTFHAKQFNSLICGCCSEDLPNCTEGGTNQDADAGICFRQGATRDPLDGQICGDRITGPLPRPAGANIICFSGIGDWTPTNGRKIDKVAFRVEAEDRGEPSRGRNADETCDYHRIRIWVPAAGEDAKVLADQACCTTALDANLNVPGIRLPNIDDGGNLLHGNIQIHPQTPNTNRGRCPVPDGTCQQQPD